MCWVSDLFGTLDPFGSGSFSSGAAGSGAGSGAGSAGGFADFSHMSKTRDPFEGRASWLPDYQKVLDTRGETEGRSRDTGLTDSLGPATVWVYFMPALLRF